jgi:spermidine synthase
VSTWLDETYRGLRFGAEIQATVFDQQSDYQRIQIVDTTTLGRALMLDGCWMTSELDERCYHELLVHPAMTTAGAIERVLIIGGGDGGSAREVLRYPQVTSLTLVEIDAMVVSACQQHLPRLGRWDDPRLTVHVADGVAYLAAAATGSCDVILIDGADPVGPAAGLFSAEFLTECARVLAPNGVLTCQAGSPLLQRDEHLSLLTHLRAAFPIAHPYYGTVPIYPGAMWSWAFASHDRNPLTVDAHRAAHACTTTWLYHPDFHRAAFQAVPNHLRTALA